VGDISILFVFLSCVPVFILFFWSLNKSCSLGGRTTEFRSISHCLFYFVLVLIECFVAINVVVDDFSIVFIVFMALLIMFHLSRAVYRLYLYVKGLEKTYEYGSFL